MQQRISMITLGVSDVSRARDFYQALGWSGDSPDGDIVIFQAGGIVVGLWGRDRLASDSAVEDAGGWGGVTLAYYVNSPGDVDQILAQAETAGATIARPAAPTSWGYSGVFIDLDGHPWEIGHNPAWIVDPEGSFKPR